MIPRRSGSLRSDVRPRVRPSAASQGMSSTSIGVAGDGIKRNDARRGRSSSSLCNSPQPAISRERRFGPRPRPASTLRVPFCAERGSIRPNFMDAKTRRAILDQALARGADSRPGGAHRASIFAARNCNVQRSMEPNLLGERITADLTGGKAGRLRCSRAANLGVRHEDISPWV